MSIRPSGDKCTMRDSRSLKEVLRVGKLHAWDARPTTKTSQKIEDVFPSQGLGVPCGIEVSKVRYDEKGIGTYFNDVYYGIDDYDVQNVLFLYNKAVTRHGAYNARVIECGPPATDCRCELVFKVEISQMGTVTIKAKKATDTKEWRPLGMTIFDPGQEQYAEEYAVHPIFKGSWEAWRGWPHKFKDGEMSPINTCSFPSVAPQLLHTRDANFPSTSSGGLARECDTGTK